MQTNRRHQVSLVVNLLH